MKTVHPTEAPKDEALEVLLDVFFGEDDEREGGSFGLTFTSNGALVSGMVVPWPEWSAAFTEQMRRGLGVSDDEAAEEDDDEESESAEREEPKGAPRRFLHMRDVKVFQGTSQHHFDLWRAALVDITGWSLGSWNPPRETADEA